jgi:DNA-binding transcriptional MerR regulator
VRISELAEATGVPVATVKYYLREGLMPAGVRVTSRLSEYDEAHVRRLRLLRVLREVGGLSITQLQDLAAALDAPSVHDMFGVAADALAPPAPASDTLAASSRAMASRVLAGAGWHVRPGSADQRKLASVLQTITDFIGPDAEAFAAPYVEMADRLGALDISVLPHTEDRAELLEVMVIGQVLFGELFSVLRRLAEEHHSSVRFSTTGPDRQG